MYKKLERFVEVLAGLFVLVGIGIFVLIGYYANEDIPKSTIVREKLENPNKFDQYCVEDDIDWFWDDSYIPIVAKKFYEVTGVQLYIKHFDVSEVESITNDTTLNKYLKEQIPLTYEQDKLDYSVVLYRSNDRKVYYDTGKYDYNGIGKHDYVIYVGDKADAYMDAEACTILLYYWNEACNVVDESEMVGIMGECIEELSTEEKEAPTILPTIMAVSFIAAAGLGVIAWILHLKRRNDILETHKILNADIAVAKEERNKYLEEE